MAFASASDLATRLGVSFTAAEQAQAAAILGDATAYLQDEIGQLIEAGTMTVVLRVRPESKRVRLPQWPVRSVTSVLLNGSAVTDYQVVDGHLHRPVGWPASSSNEYATVTVTYSYGLTQVPAELATWTMVLAAGVLSQVKRGGDMGSAGVTNERIDDYSVSYAGEAQAFSLPERQLDKLRARYGQGAHVVGSV